ncbi:NAD(P)-dependent malic enzyme [Streptomonospora litoralis]|uniref:NAD-dependent malic enzyme n=1 Tax=Streptomonospora litoralis TaxID=2498135 RepID=A0A4P6PWX7_9ACTN|nr:NADP-dependent malic enzyme [Streptomonospora litoralis]QBI52688.1 NAD-dependent malic enzyme [Streptomonospora litoralis]
MATTDSHRFDDDPAFALHRGGKLRVEGSVDVSDHEGLALAYTPGVARVCSAIADSPELVDTYTWKSSVVAVVTDGSAVLGLGDIGPQASLPVMEGKALLFRKFAGVDAVPVALDCSGVDDIVETVERMAPSFGGVNLEDISAPRCFEIERRLRDSLDIPVFHDDQHGTAIVTVAALRNAARLSGRTLGDLRVVVSGAGAAGVAVTKMLVEGGIGDIAVADSKGVIYAGRDGLTPIKAEIAEISNRSGLRGSVEAALEGADVFIGLSAGEIPESVVAGMAPDAIVFAMANPTPEIHPDVARAHAGVVATGRSDFPNQINNVLAFPGVFRGALDARASDITEAMKLAAADAIADLVREDLTADYIIPSTFDSRVVPAVAEAVADQARRDGIARA